MGERRVIHTASEYSKLNDTRWLERKYVEEGMSAPEIADEVGCSTSIVYKWLDRHGIQTESRLKYPRLANASWVREQYEEEGKTTMDIAEDVGCTQDTVIRWMEKHGIERRSNKTYPKLHDSDWLSRQLKDKGKSMNEVADELGCTHPAVMRWRDKHEINLDDTE